MKKKSLNCWVFLWGMKRHIVELSSQYWNEGYVAKNVACEFLQEYDNSSKPITSQECTHNRQHYFCSQIDVCWEEMNA